MADAIADRIRRPTPSGLCVLPGSLPVVSFGDPDAARVATLSLNPSWLEFQSPSGAWLLGADRRLPSLVSMGIEDPRDLDDEHVARVVDESSAYFRGPNWYRRWFHWLEALLRGSGAGSYLDGSACHLDLVQWATKPAQGKLQAAMWENLIGQDCDFLRWQLRNNNVDVVLLNGASVVSWVQQAGLVGAFVEDVLGYTRNQGVGQLRVFRAVAEGVAVLGWNRPLAGALAVDGRRRLTEWVSRALQESLPQETGGIAPEPARASEAGTVPSRFPDGFVPAGTVVASVSELESVLARWVKTSEQPTIGEVGTFGGAPLIKIRAGADEFVLNRDTKRAAVTTFLAAAARAGGAANLDWHITANSRGTINRVSFRPDDALTPGWYAYLRKPIGDRRRLG